MHTVINLICIIITLLGVTGCQGVGKGELFVVEFAPETTLRYKMVSKRSVEIDLGEAAKKGRKGKKAYKMSENMELVIAYKAIESDPYGLSTIQATCESAKVSRRSFSGDKSAPDAVESLAGRSFTFQVTPTGKIVDDSNLKEVVSWLGDRAFAKGTQGKTRVKNPDMIQDFIVLQLHLWDSVSCIAKPLAGVDVGQSWQVKQFVPLPIATPGTKVTTYTLTEIAELPEGRKATIDISYTLSDVLMTDWPKPYAPPFRMKSMFGMLMNYRFVSLVGTGRQVFNIDSGVLGSEEQQYQSRLSADFLLPLGDSKPVLIIDQKMSVRLLPDEKSQELKTKN